LPSSCQAIVLICPPLNVEDVVGEVMKTVAKAEETRAERRTALANILSGKGKGRKKKVGFRGRKVWGTFVERMGVFKRV